LQFLRKASQITIEALSELLGVSSSTLIAWEASATLRHQNDLTARVVIASILDRVNGPRLIHKILESIRIGSVELDPILARWSDAEGEWIIESALPWLGFLSAAMLTCCRLVALSTDRFPLGRDLIPKTNTGSV
jgi:transcriptional regulator with XRE-family HTH domain